MSIKDKIFNIEMANNTDIYPSVDINEESKCLEVLNLSDDITAYDPSFVPSVHSFMQDKPQVKIVIGPYGSGKTSAIVNRIIYDAVKMPKCNDGVRRYKVALIRNTASDLETTTLNTWLFWTRGLPEPRRNKKPVLQYFYEFWDADGKIEMHVVFLGLDRAADFHKLASLELTSAVFNEIQFIPQSIFIHMQSRIARYPSKVEFMRLFDKLIGDTVFTEKEYYDLFAKWEPYPALIYADTNPPEDDHWLVKNYELKKDKNIRIYHQLPALLQDENDEWYVNDKADNIKHAGHAYYLRMLSHGEEFVRVYGQGMYGTVVDGKRIYPGYNDDLHSIDKIEIEKNIPLGIFVDLGTVSPAVLVFQEVLGQVRAIKEFIGEFTTIKELFSSIVLPWKNRYARDNRLEIVQYDPADTYDGSSQLIELGIDCEKALTNDISKRINSVKNIQNTLIAGKPRYIISRTECPKLRQGFLGKYYYRRLRVIGEERFQDTPFKNHPYSDIHDANQYGCMYYSEGEMQIEEDIEEKYRQSKYAMDEDDKDVITGY